MAMRISTVALLLVLVAAVGLCAGGRKFKTYYDILNVTKSATARDIKLAYYKVSRINHPDRNGKRNADRRMAEVNRAYEVLKNVNQRAAYDLYLTMNSGAHHPDWDKNGSFSQWQTLMNMLYLSDYHWFWQIIIVLLLLGVGSALLGAVLTLITPIMKFASSWTFWIMLGISLFNQGSTWIYGGKKK